MGRRNRGRRRRSSQKRHTAISPDNSDNPQQPGGDMPAPSIKPENAATEGAPRSEISSKQTEKSENRVKGPDWEIAKYTRALRNWTAALAFVGIVTAIILGLQLNAMRGQLSEVKAAGQQTDKTIVALNNQADSLKGQLDSLRAFQRAFVIIPDPILHTLINPAIQSRSYTVAFAWENSGTTPTRNLITKNRCVERDNPQDLVFEFRNEDIFHSLLGPKQQIFAGRCHSFTPEEMTAYAQRTKHFFAIAEALYGDVSDPTPRHITRFCSALHGFTNAIRPGEPPTSERNVSWESCDRHNCADEECTREDRKK
jgi:hypothetical protein